jgi:hypothetical protein
MTRTALFAAVFLAIASLPANATCFSGNRFICEQRQFERKFIQDMMEYQQYEKWMKDRAEARTPRAEPKPDPRETAAWRERCKPELWTDKYGVERYKYAAPDCP